MSVPVFLALHMMLKIKALNRNSGNAPYMAQSKKLTYELVSKSERVNVNIGVSHID